jgi:hypothetical protein
MVRWASSGRLCTWRGGQAPWRLEGAWGCDGRIGEPTEKAGHEEAFPAANGEEVAGVFGASFGGQRLEEVLHTAAVLEHRRMAAWRCLRRWPIRRSGGNKQRRAARWGKAEDVALRSTTQRSIAQG